MTHGLTVSRDGSVTSASVPLGSLDGRILEKILAGMAAEASELAATVLDHLQVLGEITGADRAVTVLIFRTEVPTLGPEWIRAGQTAVMCEWTRPGLEPLHSHHGGHLEESALLQVPWLAGVCRAHDIAVIEDVRQLPDEAHRDQASLMGHGLHSVAVGRLMSRGALAGTLTLSSNNPRAWTPEHLAALAATCQMASSMVTQSAERAELQDVIARAENARRTQQEFFSTVSHELKTPLNVMMSLTQLIAEEHGPTDQVLAEDLEVILRSGQHLDAVLSGLLADALERRRENNVVRIASLDEALTDVAAWARNDAAARDITLTFPPRCGLYVPLAPTALRRTLTNLVTNAIKYNHDGGQVEVAVTTRQSKGRQLVVTSVSDTGQGLTAEQIDRVWQPFVRYAGNGPGQKDGLGLGLALARNIIEAANGTIAAESQPGEGARFWFELPSVDPPAASPPPGPVRRVPSHPLQAH